eukprot:TRINITY_DN6442_c0_g1_i9.p1 TRINITY_DN6442_c0_g1~~TRINITY_DN6442_c0_g1_i9.p1  ORF type:complete len:233 (+),score=45.63 TRINITY_DN6442_c0_g1_i9:174-872(+)
MLENMGISNPINHHHNNNNNTSSTSVPPVHPGIEALGYELYCVEEMQNGTMYSLPKPLSGILVSSIVLGSPLHKKLQHEADMEAAIVDNLKAGIRGVKAQLTILETHFKRLLVEDGGVVGEGVGPAGVNNLSASSSDVAPSRRMVGVAESKALEQVVHDLSHEMFAMHQLRRQIVTSSSINGASAPRQQQSPTRSTTTTSPVKITRTATTAKDHTNNITTPNDTLTSTTTIP